MMVLAERHVGRGKGYEKVVGSLPGGKWGCNPDTGSCVFADSISSGFTVDAQSRGRTDRCRCHSHPPPQSGQMEPGSGLRQAQQVGWH